MTSWVSILAKASMTPLIIGGSSERMKSSIFKAALSCCLKFDNTLGSKIVHRNYPVLTSLTGNRDPLCLGVLVFCMASDQKPRLSSILWSVFLYT